VISGQWLGVGESSCSALRQTVIRDVTKRKTKMILRLQSKEKVRHCEAMR